MRPAHRWLVLFALLAAGACRGRGKEVFIREGCVICHRFQGIGGGLGPDLTGVGSRMTAAAMRAKITNPAAFDPASRMPAFPRITWFDLRSLVSFLRG